LPCDHGLIHQALVNVIRNALEAMAESPSGGGDGSHELTIAVESRERRSSTGLFEPLVAMIVRDTGGGIPEHVQDRMFNPFFTTRRAGTGLGLAIVHRIVDAHSGAVRVMNITDGQGRQGAQIELLIPSMCHDCSVPSSSGDYSGESRSGCCENQPTFKTHTESASRRDSSAPLMGSEEACRPGLARRYVA
jgi:K+-sensing histidine kinase KdpD